MPVAGAATHAASRAPSRGYLYFLLFLMVFFWSLNFVIVKIALREIPPVLLAAIRAALAAILLLGIFTAGRRRRHTAPWTMREVLLLITLGIAGVALNQGFFAVGLNRTSVAHAAIIVGLTPVQVLLLATLSGQERLTLPKLTGLGVALLGVAFLQLSRDPSGAPSLTGDLCILMSGFAFAVYTVGGKNVTMRHDSVTMNLFAFGGSALAMSPVIFAAHFNFAAVSTAVWMSVAYIAIFPSVVSYLIYSYALTHMEASRTSAASYLQPLLATLLAIALLDEHLTTSIIIGGSMVLAGVWVTERV